MADQRGEGITWTNDTWNPVRGCSRISDGCKHCYADTFAGRFCGPGQPYEGLITIGVNGPRWNGKVRLINKQMDKPLRWQRPRRIFVNSMSDLFHEGFTNEEIASIFGVMAMSPKHQFQILTKRPERMREWFRWIEGRARDAATIFPEETHEWRIWQVIYVAAHRKVGPRLKGHRGGPWPLPNVWLGVSTENQETADYRIPILFDTPAAIRWVSYEPALEAVSFRPYVGYVGGRAGHCVDIDGYLWHDPGKCRGAVDNCDAKCCRNGLDWIVVGGESGSEARPFDLEWARSTIAQAKGTGCAVFVKQFGSKPYDSSSDVSVSFTKKGAGMAEWPPELKIREYPTGT